MARAVLGEKAIKKWVDANIEDHVDNATWTVELTDMGEAYKDQYDIEDEEAEEADFDKVLHDVVAKHPQVTDDGTDLVWNG